MRGRRGLCAAMLVAALCAPAGAAHADTVTFYLHSIPVTGHVESAGEFAGATPGPAMDATAPTGLDAKVMATSLIGNPDFRKNVLLSYWSGEVNGSITNATARLWVMAAVDTELELSLFSGSRVGVSSPFARTTVSVPAGGPTEVTVPLGGGGFGVLRTLVLQAAADRAALIVYDSTAFPSSLTFDVGPYVPRPSAAWTPQAGFGPVTAVTTTLANREASLAIDPSDERRMLMCSPSGVPNYPYGQSYFHATSDDGASWHPLYVETSPTDTRRAALEGGDCDVAFDEAGTMYAADTWLGSLSVGASTDHGETWTGTAFAATAPVVDRPWLVGGPPGTVHVTWQDVQFAMPTAIWYTRSIDYGRTFLPAVLVAGPGAEQPMSWEGNYVVSPSGEDLFLVYNRRNDVTGAGEFIRETGGERIEFGDEEEEIGIGTGESVWVAASHDGGLTWSSTLVAHMPNRASYLYPSIGMDSGGGLHIVFASRAGDAQPVWYTTSADGTTWTAPVTVMNGVSGYAPWVAGGGPGEAAIQWLGTFDLAVDTGEPHDWYVFWARVVGGAVAGSGTTTSTPIFSGVQGETPEFNQIRLDSAGRMRFGTAVKFAGEEDTGWALLYQAGP